jgi:hypothetical protein
MNRQIRLVLYCLVSPVTGPAEGPRHYTRHERSSRRKKKSHDSHARQRARARVLFFPICGQVSDGAGNEFALPWSLAASGESPNCEIPSETLVNQPAACVQVCIELGG